MMSFHLLIISDYVERIFPIAFAVEDTTDTARSASYSDLHPE